MKLECITNVQGTFHVSGTLYSLRAYIDPYCAMLPTAFL